MNSTATSAEGAAQSRSYRDDTVVILLVDDEEIYAERQRLVLESNNYSVRVAHSGEAALEIIRGGARIDLVLMDLELRERMDGADVAREILHTHPLPVLFLTQHTDKAYTGRADLVTPFAYIVKSSGDDVLLQSIKMSLRLYRTQRELEHSRNLYASVADLAGEVIARIDRSGRLEFINREAERAFGLDSESARGESFWELIHPEDRAATIRGIESVRAGGPQPVSLVNRLRVGGGWRTFEWSGAPISDDRHGVVGIQVTGRDITEREQKEAEIRTLLKEKERLMKELRHRIKNDLHLLQSLLRVQASQTDNSATRESLYEATNRIAALAGVYDRLNKQTGSDTIHVRRFILELLEGIRNTTVRSAVTFDAEIEDSTVSDRFAVNLGIIVNEVITNALKYGAAAEGSAELLIRIWNPQKGRLSLRFADAGAGFPEEVIRGEEVGFGLTVVEELVGEYGGRLRLSNTPGATIEIDDLSVGRGDSDS